MTSGSSKKRLEKVTGSQYDLLRDLTETATLDAMGLQAAVDEITKDRREMAHGFLRAAETLAKNKNPMVRRSAVSRAYYGAYQAARATVLSVHHRDEHDHERLGKEIESIKGMPGSAGVELKELRRLRNEFDYSPYPGKDPGTLYDARTTEVMIKGSLQTAARLVRAFEKRLEQRERTS